MSARLYQSAAHRFLRNPNNDSSIFKRAWSRGNPFENTFTLLEDPKTGKKVYLIGTTNSSTILATRTKKLIEAIKPDSVLVQTSLPWYKRACHIQVDNQEQFNRLQGKFDDLISKRIWEEPSHLRGLFFKFRMIGWMAFMNFYLSFPIDFNPWRPGVEMLWAIKAAEKTGSKIKFLGTAFNRYTISAMVRENNIGFIRPFWKFMRGESFATWRNETLDQLNVLRTHGGVAYGENLDSETTSWWVKWFERVHPEMKHILVDSEDVRFLEELLLDEGKTIVAVVNQWHFPGVSTYWRRHTYTEPEPEFINPIGDMDINQIQEGNLVNDMLRRFYTKRTKSEPAAWSNYLTHYHKSVMEPERERHVFFEGVADHHMEHGLFNDENITHQLLGPGHHEHGKGYEEGSYVEDKAERLEEAVGNKEGQQADASRSKGKKGRKN